MSRPTTSRCSSRNRPSPPSALVLPHQEDLSRSSDEQSHRLRAEHHLENGEAFRRHSERRYSIQGQAVVIKGSEELDSATSALAHNLYAWAYRFWRSGHSQT
jgi:hypothetical protein